MIVSRVAAEALNSNDATFRSVFTVLERGACYLSMQHHSATARKWDDIRTRDISSW